MNIIRYIKEPGSIRIITGSCVVFILLFMAFFGDKVLSYSAQYMDPKYIMEPPSMKIFRSFLITEKGLRNLRPYEYIQTRKPSSADIPGFEEGLMETAADTGWDESLSDTVEEDSSQPTAEPAGKGTDPIQEDQTIVIQGGEEEEDLDFLADEGEEKKAEKNGGMKRETDEEDLSYLAEDGGEKREEDTLFTAPKHKHYFGTNKDGRDLLALLVAGAKTCLLPGLLACLVALGLGIPLGIMGGYYGGRWADFILFMNSVILSFPRFILILIVICALEPNVYYTMVVLGLTILPRVSEQMRTRVRALSNMGFVLAAKESGLSDWKIMARHLFWFQNRTIFFIQASLIMSESILVETTLSYLQFGTKAPDVSWGNIIEGSRLAFFSEYYWITFFPAVAIVIAILGFFYLGDGLNAKLEYRERK
jgi:peptide/nickel transport system permease protein